MCVCVWACVCACFNAEDWSAVAPPVLSTAEKENKFIKAFCESFGLGGGVLAGEQLGGLEHNYKVDDLSGAAVAPSWYPLSFLLKPLNYSSINSDFFVFSPLTRGAPRSWLRTSILFLSPLLSFSLTFLC